MVRSYIESWSDERLAIARVRVNQDQGVESDPRDEELYHEAMMYDQYRA
jgi:hypothetical protein